VNNPETSFISSFTGNAQIATLEEFRMSHWVELQFMLKSNYFVILNGNILSSSGNRKLIESHSKKKIVEEIDQLIIDYNNIFLKIRENNERIRKTLEKVIIFNNLKAYYLNICVFIILLKGNNN